jgi:hypothetical protein
MRGGGGPSQSGGRSAGTMTPSAAKHADMKKLTEQLTAGRGAAPAGGRGAAPAAAIAPASAAPAAPQPRTGVTLVPPRAVPPALVLLVARTVRAAGRLRGVRRQRVEQQQPRRAGDPQADEDRVVPSRGRLCH